MVTYMAIFSSFLTLLFIATNQHWICDVGILSSKAASTSHQPTHCGILISMLNIAQTTHCALPSVSYL